MILSRKYALGHDNWLKRLYILAFSCENEQFVYYVANKKGERVFKVREEREKRK